MKRKKQWGCALIVMTIVLVISVFGLHWAWKYYGHSSTKSGNHCCYGRLSVNKVKIINHSVEVSMEMLIFAK